MGSRKRVKRATQDLYQAEDSDAEEDRQAGQRYDDVDNFQYELPEDFVDEEIDEDLAFTEEDKRQMAQLYRRRDPTEEELGSPGELTRDDFSDDDSEADRLYGKPQHGPTTASASQDEAESASDVDDIFAAMGSDDGSEGSEIEEENSDDSDQDQHEDAETVQRAVQDTLGPRAAHRKREKPAVQDEAVPESQYNLAAGGELGELTLADMLRELGPQMGKQSQAHKQLSQLAKKAQAVEAPLPRPIRQRKERQAGYEDTKKDVTKWTPIVRVNREAPTLVFQSNSNDLPRTSTTAALAAKFKPESKMEAEVAALLKSAGAQNEQEMEEAEETLALQAVTAEELAKRREELAKMRSLLFRHEEKSRHMAKIKSKDYHRRMKKSARLKAERAGELGDKDFIRLQAEKAEYDRAKERLTLKHKNTSQWARRALKRGVDQHADGKKEAIAEQLRLGEELRRKIDRVDTVLGSDEEADEATSSESEPEEGQGAGRKGLSSRAKSKLKETAADILEEGSDEEASKGLFSLPFMRRAQEKRKQAAQEEARQLLAELDGDAPEESVPTLGRRNFGLQDGIQANDAGIDAELLDPESGSDMDEDAEAKLDRLRRAKQPNSPTNDTEDSIKVSSQKLGKGRKAKQQAAAEVPEAQPWTGMTAATDGPISIQSDLATLQVNGEQLKSASSDDEETSESTRVANRGVLANTAAGQRALQTTAHVLLPPAENGRTPQPITTRKAGKSRKAAASHGRTGGPEAPSSEPAFIRSKAFGGEKPGYHFGQGKHGLGYYKSAVQNYQDQHDKKRRKLSPDTAQEQADTLDDAVADLATAQTSNDEAAGDKGQEMAQREIIARAFAGDNVAAEFEAEKAAEAEQELPKIETPTVLPGWGAWASSQKEPRWLAAAKLKAERQKQAARAGRKDAKLEAVVISERWDKKAAKYNSTTLPFPFTSKEAFEGSIRQPLGSDFNSQQSFRQMTKPAIIKSSGVIIQPLKYSQGAAEEQRKVQKTKNGSRQAVARVSGGAAQPQRKRRS